MPTTPTPETLLADRQWIEDLARRLVRDPNAAEDVAQETWRRVLERPPGALASPRGWLHSVVKSCARERWRGDTRRLARERAASRPESTPGAAHLVARADAQRTVLDAVLALDSASREVVLLRYFEDLEPWQIARRVGAPQGTIRSRLHRALAVLRERLDDEYGGSAAWGAALLGPGWRTATPSAGTTTISKGVFVMTTQAKAILGATAVLALVLLWWRADGAAPAPAPAPAQADEAVAPPPRAAPARRTPAADETATTAESPPSAVPAATSPAVPSPKRLPVRLLQLDDTATDPADEHDAADEPKAIGEAAGTVTVEGGAMVLEGGWTKWKPVPEKGTATLRGKVVDSTGAPLAGAAILRVETAAGGVDGDVRDFRHITAIGESAADGSFTIAQQPARSYRLAANWHHTMNRPQGLLFAGLVAVEPNEKQTVSEIELRVPVDARDFGAVTGRVVDDDGNPVRTEVYVGFAAAMTGADGRFRIAPVAAGDGEVAVDAFEYRPWRRAVTVRAGADAEVEIKLTQNRTGPHEIDGFVRDTEGRPVADAEMFCGGFEDVYRRQRTGADGSFRFRRLPPCPAGVSYYLSVNSDGIVQTTRNGFSAPAHGLVFEVERSVKLRLLVRDATTSAPLPLFNVTISRAVVQGGATIMEPMLGVSEYDESGAWTADVPRGEIFLFVEAPERRGFNGAIDVPRDGAEFEAVIEMQR